MAGQEHIADRTSREYETMVRAVHAMEEALASPAPGRERAWKQRARRELAAVVGYLQEHCQSAESRDGLLTQIELALGRSYEVTETRTEHERLVRDAVSLLAALEESPDEAGLSYQEVRARLRLRGGAAPAPGPRGGPAHARLRARHRRRRLTQDEREGGPAGLGLPA